MIFYQNHLLASRRRKEDRPTWRAKSSLASSPRRVPGVPKSWQVTPIFGWLVVWNRNFYLYIYIYIYIYGNVIIPADFNSMIFQRGVRQPPTSWGWKFRNFLDTYHFTPTSSSETNLLDQFYATQSYPTRPKKHQQPTTHPFGYAEHHLVGGIPTPLKNMSSSMGRMTSHIWHGK